MMAHPYVWGSPHHTYVWYPPHCTRAYGPNQLLLPSLGCVTSASPTMSYHSSSWMNCFTLPHWYNVQRFYIPMAVPSFNFIYFLSAKDGENWRNPPIINPVSSCRICHILRYVRAKVQTSSPCDRHFNHYTTNHPAEPDILIDLQGSNVQHN